MSIAELKFPDGEPLPTDPSDIRGVIGRLLVAHVDELDPLEPGQYNVTPAIWTKNLLDHELVVLDDGTGIYRTYPRHRDSGYYAVTQGSSRLRRGGQQQPINLENPFALIAGGHPRKHDLQIFGLIAYIPL